MASAPPPRSAAAQRQAPRRVLLALLLALAAQLAWQAGQPAPRAHAQDLPPPPSTAALQLAALGDPVALSRVTMLYVQGFDEQAGISIAWRELDYGRVVGWLQRVLDLDPRSQYPLLAASTVYGAVSDPARARQMLDFVYARFAEDPDRRWPWLAQAALAARHRLHDLPLARRYAAAIRQQATGPGVPPWARELEIFMAEDMDELDAARALAGALLRSGRITDPHELQFLAERLQQLEQRSANHKR
jgi:hypothetical protein